MDFINRISMNIRLGNVFRNYLWKKNFDFLTIFYISHISNIKILINWLIN